MLSLYSSAPLKYGCFPSVRTDRPDNSRGNLNFLFNQHCPARSVKLYIALARRRRVFSKKPLGKSLFHRQNDWSSHGPATGQFWLLEGALNSPVYLTWCYSRSFFVWIEKKRRNRGLGPRLWTNSPLFSCHNFSKALAPTRGYILIRVWVSFVQKQCVYCRGIYFVLVKVSTLKLNGPDFVYLKCWVLSVVFLYSF